MSSESLKETIRRELPTWLREDPEFRAYVLELTRHEYANRTETGDRFYQLLGELRRDREEQAQKWAANQAELQRLREEEERRWAEYRAERDRDRKEQAQKWDQNQTELKRLREEQADKWAEQSRKWEENQAELKRLREEQAQKWDKNQAELVRLHEEIMTMAQRYDRGIGALGSRWGLQSEKAFRDALAGILEKNFDVQVMNVTDYDDDGEVFGRPEQIELDVVITNGRLLLCELKSSIDKAGMYSFERKARFYEKRHERKADRLIVISPMIDARARKVAKRLGIETYGDSIEVEEL
jgi:hypothetical protein